MVHRVLAIPELLALIFSHLDRQSNAINACISKQWSNIALDTIWADVDDLHRLFSLLVPLTKVRGVYVMSFLDVLFLSLLITNFLH